MRISDWSSDVCSSDLEESRDGGRDLRGIFVNASSRGGKSLAVTAEGGEFLATDDPDVIILRLRNGTLVHNMPGYSAPRVLSFEAHDLPIRSEEHTSELQSLMRISYAVFCLKKKNRNRHH